jgi:hypothetical protein
MAFWLTLLCDKSEQPGQLGHHCGSLLAREETAANVAQAIEIVERTHTCEGELEMRLLLKVRDLFRAEHRHQQFEIGRGFLGHTSSSAREREP